MNTSIHFVVTTGLFHSHVEPEDRLDVVTVFDY